MVAQNLAKITLEIVHTMENNKSENNMKEA